MDVQSARVSRQRLRPRDTEGRGRRAGTALCLDQGTGHGDFRRRRQDGVDQHPFPPVRGLVAERETDVLPGVGHMVQNAVPDLVIAEIDAMIGSIGHGVAAGGE